MANLLATSVARNLKSLFEAGSAAGLFDRQLLERFVARRDSGAEAAFAALVTRHGPMILGLSIDEAARRLRCPAGTLRSRLVRARARLRRGLIRRGVTAGALAAASTPRPTAAVAISSSLWDIATRAAFQFAAEGRAADAISASAPALARQVLRSILSSRLRVTMLTLAFLGAIAGGAGFAAQAPGRQPGKPGMQKSLAGKPDLLRIAAEPEDGNPEPGPGRMHVIGRVLDTQGKPLPKATTMVYATLKQPGRSDRLEWMAPSAVGEATSDASGRFRLDATRTSIATHEQATVIAAAPGFGAGWAELDLDAVHPTVDITLRPEQVIRGRLFDLQGQPVPGVTVSVTAMGRVVRDPEGDPDEGVDGPDFLWGNRAKGRPAWPRPVRSDADGRFTVRGAGQGLRVVLTVDDTRFARQIIKVDTDNTPSSKPVITALEPARMIVGRVVAADTGKPIAKVMVSANTGDAVETDADGRFRARAESPGRYVIQALAPQGQPYLNVRTAEFAWTKGAIEHRIDLTLPRGIVIRGKVTEEDIAKPIAGTMVGYLCGPAQAGPTDPWFGRAWAGPDGSFQLAVSPKSTHLIALGPSEDYVLQVTGERMIQEGQPGGRRIYAHAFIAHDRKAGGETRNVDVVLRRGMTVKGEITSPDGQPVQEALMVSRLFLMPSGVPWRSWQGDYHGTVRNGRFELHGLTKGPEIPVFFLEPKRKLGATVNLSGKSGSHGPITVRLAACGTARARLVDPAGKPLAGYRDPYLIAMVVTPGPSWFTRDKADQSRLAGENDYVCRIDPVNYPDGCVSDSLGRVIFPALIPGATYQIDDMSAIDDKGGGHLRKEFTVKPGETLELGDIRIEKPEA